MWCAHIHPTFIFNSDSNSHILLILIHIKMFIEANKHIEYYILQHKACCKSLCDQIRYAPTLCHLLSNAVLQAIAEAILVLLISNA